MSKVVIEIKDPEVNSLKKFRAAVDVLAKASGVSVIHDHDDETPEPTPYKSLQDLDNHIKKRIAYGLAELLRQIVIKWLRADVQKAQPSDEVYTLNGKTYLNPQTGQALTVDEWKQITTDLDRILGKLYGATEEYIAMRALAMGKVLHGMDTDAQIGAGMEHPKFDDAHRVVTADDTTRNMYNFAQIHTGELIQDVVSRDRRRIMNTIMAGYANKWDTRTLQSQLFETFSTLNRDWRRIAETETANNFNNGYLLAEIEKHPGQKYILMRGISAANACDWCKAEVNNKIVALMPEAPTGAGPDTVSIDGIVYTAIWPGKSNYGRKRMNWWVASGTQHPHCRCTWVRYYGGINAWAAQQEQKLREAIDRATGGV